MLKFLLKDYRFIFHVSVLQAFLNLLPNKVILINEYLPSHVFPYYARNIKKM